MTEQQPAPETTPRERALRLAIADLERHVGTLGWDGPVFVFALVRTANALALSPALAEQLPAEAVQAAEEDPEHLTSIEQDGLPEAGTLEELLGQLAWPDLVDGAAVVVERMVVPPEAESGMPTDPEAAVAYLMDHPDREDVRMAAGVLRTGESWCTMRARSHDFDDSVIGSPDAVPGLVEALRSTFA
ncbi:PPA1309 family protein [Georgenia sp. SYP-B2076]|uniref:PPA1309 family protein n=1 Tax=Georgenia sp. SYP-B2076 TaxID=2495881 RepID=UPI000F8C79E4|nr:PPA1309 family protein [Georgenia sp. SYP-B2076]